MKNDSDRILMNLNLNDSAPLYQCPNCQTKWLIIGLEQLREHICRSCSHRFNPDSARFNFKRLTPEERSVWSDAA